MFFTIKICHMIFVIYIYIYNTKEESKKELKKIENKNLILLI